MQRHTMPQKVMFPASLNRIDRIFRDSWEKSDSGSFENCRCLSETGPEVFDFFFISLCRRSENTALKSSEIDAVTQR